jgi:polysaccharide export outer membrane protein
MAKSDVNWSVGFKLRRVLGLLFPIEILLVLGLGAQDQTAKAQIAADSTPAPITAPQRAAPMPEDTRLDQVSSTALHLEAGDLIQISVYNVPELSTKSRISSAGDVYLPLVDYVHIAGMTTEQAEAVIQRRLSDGGFVKNPHASVFVEESASRSASVMGEVTRPGIYPVLGQRRLFDLISAAGGLTDKAGRSATVTHRDQPDQPATVALSRNMADNPESNIPVLPGDTIIVRKADVVYVVGDVGRPSGFLMDSGHLTVLQAIAMAGGTGRTAKIGGARIIRKGPDGMTETPLHLKQILEAKAPDLPMQADDILFVPTSAGKALAGRTLEAAIQAATAVSIIAIQ